MMAGARVVRILRIVKLLKQVYEIKKKGIHKVENDLGECECHGLAQAHAVSNGADHIDLKSDEDQVIDTAARFLMIKSLCDLY